MAPTEGDVDADTCGVVASALGPSLCGGLRAQDSDEQCLRSAGRDEQTPTETHTNPRSHTG